MKYIIVDNNSIGKVFYLACFEATSNPNTLMFTNKFQLAYFGGGDENRNSDTSLENLSHTIQRWRGNADFSDFTKKLAKR